MINNKQMTAMNTPQIGQFSGFKPEAMQRIANSLGYQGDMNGFPQYLQQNPAMMQRMNQYQNYAMQMARGGMVKKYATGGTVGAPGELGHQGPGNNDGVVGDGKGGVVGAPGYGNTGGGTNAVGNADEPTNQGGTWKSTGEASYFVPNSTNPVLQTGGLVGTTFNAVANTINNTAADTTDTTDTTQQEFDPIYKDMVQQATAPALPTGAVTQPVATIQDPRQMISPTAGQIGTIAPATAAQTTGVTAAAPTVTPAATTTAATTTPQVQQAVTGLQGAQGVVDPRAQVEAATQAPTTTQVATVEAAQGTAYLMDNAPTREIQQGEIISGVADAEKASLFNEQIQAATATPTKQATVQGQLEDLMTQFEGGNTPAWAAGALRAATATMAQRGLAASSIAGQAVVQAAMEASLPIAAADAQTFARFEQQNLTNRQQRAMLAAEQRATFMGMEFNQAFQARVANAAKISDIANLNFTAEQQVMLENANAVNTMNLNNLSNRQAVTMAEAAAIAQLEAQNLNNRQQAAVQNAKSFLQMDMQNLSNQQQMDVFAAQSMVQSLFTDQAAENAARQFNATSQNQVDQFFASLSAQVNQYNASQQNAIALANTDATNAMLQFSQNLQTQRDQFNASNQLIIEQSNAQWRRQIATADTTAINRANEINASNVLDVSQRAYAEVWQNYADTIEMAWTSSESALDRDAALARAAMQINADKAAAALAQSNANSRSFGNALFNFFASDTGGDILSSAWNWLTG